MGVALSIVGGFLGAGKTSLIASQASFLESRGERVAVITNDQGKDLIDTRTMSSKNIIATEVTGGCFCCRFDDLEQAIRQVTSEYHPTWIFAEAVGSCTDLVATVMRPLWKFHRDAIQLSPITIVVDPLRARSILNAGTTRFSDEVDYLYVQQIKEADIVLINKVDITSDTISTDVQTKLQSINPKALFIHTSAMNGDGLSRWSQQLNACSEVVARSSLDDLDYERYAVAEAHLGWVNMSLEWSRGDYFQIDVLVKQLAENIRYHLGAKHFEAAHVKLMGLSAAGHINGSLTTTFGQWQWYSRVNGSVNTATVIINARVCSDPEELSEIVSLSMAEVCKNHEVHFDVTSQQAFRPSPPTPMYRQA